MFGEMTNGGRIRQSFPGARDLTSTEGSEYGPVEFTREDVDALLHERIKYKSKYNYKVSLSLSLSFLDLSVSCNLLKQVYLSKGFSFFL